MMVVKGCGYPQIDTAETGRRLRNLSRQKDIPVGEIQRYLGLASNQAVYEWFNGKCLPTLNNFFALSRLFSTPMEEMLIVREKRPKLMKKDRGVTWVTEAELFLEEGCPLDVECFRKRTREYEAAILKECA